MYPSRNTRSGYTASKETFAIVPPTSATSPYLTKYDLGNIYSEMKSINNQHHSDMKSINNHITDMRSDMNNHISSMLEKITDISYKIDNQEEQLTELSSKLSNH